MILGVVLRGEAPRPRWLGALALQYSAGAGPARLHLGVSGDGSRFRDGPLTVVAESTRISGLDARAVAEAYRHAGTACVRYLPGRFRFLLHDAEVGTVVAGSSTTPPWPLSYWSDSLTTIVGSRLIAMLQCPDVPRAVDESYLAHLVLGLSAMSDGSTVLRGIRRLCPGEVLVIDGEGTTAARVLRVDRLTPRHVARDREQLGPLFVDELAQTVRPFVANKGSVISLSGGLDSAAIAGVGLRHVHDVAAFSFVAPALDRRAELESLDAMERAWPGLHLTRVDASDTGDFPDLGELRDDPLLTPLALLPARMLLWMRVRHANFTTVVEGEGGDELFAMLPTPLDALRGGHFLAAGRHVIGSKSRRNLLEHGIFLPMLPAHTQRAWLAWRKPLEAHLPAFAAPDALEYPEVREAVTETLATLVHRPFAARLNEWLSAPTVVGALLSREHLAASFGLELEWPMLDRSVLELVLGLHAANAVHGGPRKAFLQTALVGTVPDEVRLTPKNVGLYRAFIPRILTSRRSREALRHARVKARVAHLVRFERVEAMLNGLAAGQSLTTDALWALECLVGFAEWYARASDDYGVT